MIARMTGKLLELMPPKLMIELNNIAYELEMPLSDCSILPQLDSIITVYTHLSIKEDAHNLYAFIDVNKRDCFRTLIKISGIGAKIALALLSTLSVSELQAAIINQDINRLCLTPGVGKKVAERMLVELKGKTLISDNTLDGMMSCNSNKTDSDLIQALLSLGYNDKDISRVIKNLPSNTLNDLNLRIRESLKLLSRQ